MEIVPKQTRDKVEMSTAHLHRTPSSVHKVDDDIGGDMESGIEVSSDGDQNQNIDKSKNEMEDQDEDDMSDGEDQITSLTDTDDDLGGDSLVDLDQISLASSSFYEYNNLIDEYKPTELTTSDVITIEPVKMQAMPFTGPLMVTLFGKLDQMMTNSLYENLLLTGVITRLACYPQPLLRSFLLNTRMVFHPSVRSLYQVLTNVRNKLLAYSSTISDFSILVGRAQKYLLARGCIPHHMHELYQMNGGSVVDRPMPVPKVKTRVLGDILRRRVGRNKKQTLSSRIDSLLEGNKKTTPSGEVIPVVGAGVGSSTFYLRQQERSNQEERKIRELKTKNAVYATIVFAEFLKELAAVSQEHAIVTSS